MVLPKTCGEVMFVFLITIFSFLPLCVAMAWMFWWITSIGGAGYTGVVDPGVIATKLFRSVQLGALFTCTMIAITGVRIAILNRRNLTP